MDKIKVLEFVGSMNCGGTETMLMNIFRKMDKDKFEVTFAVNMSEKGWYDDEIIKLGGNILKIERIEKLGINKYVQYLTEILKREEYDVVHSHTFLHSGLVMKAAKKAGIKIRISHSHSAMDNYEKSNFKYKMKKIYLQKLILKNSTHLLACSTEAGECLFGNQFRKRGTILKNPIRVDEIEKVINEEDIGNKIKKEYKIKENQLILGHVGRFVSIKNHNFLLEIAKKLKKRNIEFRMFLIGDGELIEETKRKCTELDLEDYIIFTGNKNNVYEYMSVFEIFLLPSFYEGLPLTAIEAQGLGIRTILSNEISREADLKINLVDFLPINQGIDIWVDKILEYKTHNIKDKEKSIKALKDNGFEIESSIKILTDIYSRKVGKYSDN